MIKVHENDLDITPNLVNYLIKKYHPIVPTVNQAAIKKVSYAATYRGDLYPRVI